MNSLWPRRLFPPVAVALITVCAIPSWADNLTLAELIGASLQASPAVKASRATSQGSAEASEVAKWQRFPSLTLQTESRLGGSEYSPYANNQAATTARLEMSLWSAGRITAEIDAANLRKVAADWAVEESREQAALRTVAAWRSMVNAAASIEQSDRANERLIQLEAKIKRRIDAGLSASIDMDSVQARKLQVATERSASLAQLSIAIARLNLQVGPSMVLNLPQEMQSIDQQVKRATFAGQLPNSSNTQSYASRRPAYLRALAEAQVANLEIAAAGARRFPELVARYQYQPATSGVPSTEGVFITLNYQSGSGLATWTQVKTAQARYESLLSTADNVLLDATDAIIADAQEYADATERLLQAEQAIQKSLEVLDSSLRLFDAGKRNVLEILSGLRELDQNEKARAPLQAQRIAAHYALGMRLGSHPWQSSEFAP